MLYTIMVTGSRTWPTLQTFRLLEGVQQVMNTLGDHDGGVPAHEYKIIHGGAVFGADRLLAENTWQLEPTPVMVRPYKPDWSLGRHAGFLRNQAMVDSGPDAVAAFTMPCIMRNCRRNKGLQHVSHGTADAITRAEKAKIPVYIFPYGFASPGEVGLF